MSLRSLDSEASSSNESENQTSLCHNEETDSQDSVCHPAKDVSIIESNSSANWGLQVMLDPQQKTVYKQF